VDIWSFLFPGEDKKKRRFIFQHLGDMFPSGPRGGSGPGALAMMEILFDVI
jgi:hypothetical protein